MKEERFNIVGESEQKCRKQLDEQKELGSRSTIKEHAKEGTWGKCIESLLVTLKK